MTWAIVMLNLLVLVYCSSVGLTAQNDLDEIMRNRYFVRAQGRIYAQFLEESADPSYPPFLHELAKQVLRGESERFEVLGQLAFRDLNFFNAAETMTFSGDVVALKIWKERVSEIKKLQAEHPSFTFGLNGEDLSITKWFTYIFVHSGWFHFAGNMLFLLIFGAMLESQIGGLGLLVSFVLSGLLGAGMFAMMTGMTSSPLVGASGAISGVMVLYSVLNWKRPARFFYWLFLPFRGFMGFLYLPTWVALAFWAVNDVSGYLGSLPELGGIAHAAHLGGEGAGLLIGGIVLLLRKWGVTPTPAISAEQVDRRMPVGKLIPFLPAVRPAFSKKSA